MERRDFLKIVAGPASPAATVLYDDRSVALDCVGPDPKRASDALWIRKRDLPRVNGFELKPQGACRADLCIPIPKDMVRGDYFNLTAFAKKAGQPVVAEPGARVWSFGEMQALGGGLASSRVAPDFEVPGRLGRPVHLAGFRGKKAQDTGGEAAAGKWYDAAKATFTTLVDTKHTVSSVFQFINVPMGVWIDEQGRVVRPAEPAWTSSRTDTFGGKSLAIEGDLYVAAVRNWVTNGDKSAYVLSDEEFAQRVKPRSPAEMEADASFKLAVWFQQAGNAELAAKYFERAQALNPDDWNYHRQEWSVTPQEAGKKWLEKFQKQRQPYYPTLDLKPKGEKPKG